MKRHVIFIAALLTTTWPDGTTHHTAAVDEQTCITAATYDLSHGAISANCTLNLNPSDAGFKPGWDCIVGFNCK